MAASLEESNEGRFRSPKTAEDESNLLKESIPKSTVYKNKWAVKIFREWKASRKVQRPVLDPGGAFKDYSELHKVQPLSTDLESMDACSLNYWLSKFVQEVSNAEGERYPARTLYGIICGIRRHLVEIVGSEALNPLQQDDKRFAVFRRCLDAEMKDSTRKGVSLQTKKSDKEAVTDEEEEKFWSAGLFGSATAKTLLDTIYFYNGKLFGLRGGEHRNICVNNFSLGPNEITFEENMSKTFHGGITDLKYVPRRVRHVCHSPGEEHDRCLVKLYQLYIGLVETLAKKKDAFYFRPSSKKLSFENSPVGINKLNSILPNLCESVGIKKKTAHCLRVTCVSKLFNSGVEEKLIRERTGHRSNALFAYEKTSEEKVSHVSSLLAPERSDSARKGKGEGEDKKKCVVMTETGLQSSTSSFLNSASFANCDVNIIVNSGK